jgi:hypothetical protein
MEGRAEASPHEGQKADRFADRQRDDLSFIWVQHQTPRRLHDSFTHALHHGRTTTVSRQHTQRSGSSPSPARRRPCARGIVPAQPQSRCGSSIVASGASPASRAARETRDPEKEGGFCKCTGKYSESEEQAEWGLYTFAYAIQHSGAQSVRLRSA